VGRLEGKVTVVTGAGSGIGRAGSYAFAREGAIVGVLGRTASKVEAVAADIGATAFPLACDLSDEAQVMAAFDEVRRRHGRLDVLYTVAGVQLYGEDAAVDALELEVFERTYRNNVRGTFLACKYGSRLMVEGGEGGSIILTGSPTGLTMVGADFAAYSTSKAAVGGLARSMAGALGRHGIRVNVIVPGPIRTELTEQRFSDPAVRERLTSRTPLGIIGEPTDMDGVAVHLASDESRFSTGSFFFVDGGMCAR
jgi:NAD(P)-dependent dehydrogenase (short-subunit alcohol dehydrogenase family)